MSNRMAELVSAQRRKLDSEYSHRGEFNNAVNRQQAWDDLARAPGRLAQGAFTGLVGAPVDIMNMALRPVGLGSDRPIGGSSHLADLINADESSVPYQAGTMLPISPEGLAMGGAKLAGLAGVIGRGAKTGNLDDMLNVARTADQYTPLNVKPNKYQINPDYNTGLDNAYRGELPTRQQYENILYKQKAEADNAQAEFQRKLQVAIDADARRAAELRDVQYPSEVSSYGQSIQQGINGDDWLKKRLAELEGNPITAPKNPKPLTDDEWLAQWKDELSTSESDSLAAKKALNIRKDELSSKSQGILARIHGLQSGKEKGSFDDWVKLEDELKAINQQYDALNRGAQ